MKLLLLGNGFDLYHKFPTKYENFLHTVEFLQKYYDEKKMHTLEDIFGDERLLESDRFIHLCYETYKSAYTEIKIDAERINTIISISKDNIWFKYFLSSYNKELGWIDFEREMSFVINAFECFLYNYGDVENIDFSDEKKDEYILRFFKFYYEFELSAIDSIYQTQIGVYKLAKTYQIEEPTGSKNMILNKERLITELYTELLKLAEVLSLYLKVFVDEPINTLIEKGLISKNSIFDGADDVITFNYTETFEKIYRAQKIHHIHGDLTSSIILGVNPDVNDEPDSESVVDTDFLRFKKYYQRVLNGTDASYLKAIQNVAENKLRFQKSNYDCHLYVAGHSLDITDRDVLEEVFSLATKIVIICYDESKKADTLNNLIRIYGKRGFDSLRIRTNMEFKLYSDFE